VKSQRLLRSDAARIWSAALRAVDAEPAVRKVLKRNGSILEIGKKRYDLGKIRKLWVLGAGKAAAPMGRAVERILGKYVAGGILVTKYGHGHPLKRLDVIEAGHPLPDSNSVASANRMMGLIRTQICADDMVLCLFSGGASSLLISPADGISLEDKLECTRLMINSGADIRELNAVRKHLSTIKGGGLARLLTPAKTVALVLSDVVGDDLSTIGSGPLAPDPTTFGDCLNILQKLRIAEQLPVAVRRRLKAGVKGRIAETPKKRDPVFQGIEHAYVGNNAQACKAAAREAGKLGYRAMILTSRLEGDNGEAARFHMSIAEEIALHNRPVRRPACLISGGETTVKVSGKGMGGRNQEFVLHCVRTLANLSTPCVVASLGTDGTDGPTDAAGAIADNASLVHSLDYGSDFLSKSLADNDSYQFFKSLDDLIITGPTRTNVMDLHLILLG
jgi:hydroxypyruvate reductase